MSQAERRRGRAHPVTAEGHAIHLDIERLALYGMATADAEKLARALETEFSALARQATPGVAPAELDRLPLPRIAAGPTPEHTGRHAAGAIWSGIIGIGQGNPR